jgi:hypothetical protein
MQNPDHNVMWLPTRPEFTIRLVSSTNTNRGYHESHYEVVSRFAVSADDFKRLDECGLLGSGQSYYVLSESTFDDSVPPVVVDKRTGKVVPDAPIVNWTGEPITNNIAYEYHKYVVRRICDSGD